MYRSVASSRKLTNFFKLKNCVKYQRSYHVQNQSQKPFCVHLARMNSSCISDGVVVDGTYITLNDEVFSHPLKLNLMWLRDNCRCPKCYNHITSQRKQSILDLMQCTSVKEYSLENKILKITWANGHNSTYTLDSLIEFCGKRKVETVATLWNRKSVNLLNVVSLDVNDFLHGDNGVRELLTSIIQFGVGFVKNVYPSKEATEFVIQKISHVQRTFFGDMWEFSDILDHEDTAYSREALGAHTDNTYFSEAAGLQVFHCLHHNGTGGETLLVDGFNAAHCLKKKHPAHYSCLTETLVESEYIGKEKHYLACDPILKINALSGELQQIRFNLYDRAPIRTISTKNMQQFYESLIYLSSIVLDPSNEWWFKLQPGTILFFDNWRILHGRASYTGHRKIAGCYIGYSDWRSKARTLGLL